MKLNGKIIAIEGIDGSGKQTQVEHLKRRLENAGYEVYTKPFPNYDSMSSAPVKMYLQGELGNNPEDVTAKAASILFAVDRYITYKKEMEREYLEGKKVMLLDRYVGSNIIHQASKLISDLQLSDVAKCDKEITDFISWLTNLEYNDFGLPRPDKTIYLNVPVEYAIKLREKRANKITGEKKQDIHEQDNEYLKKCSIVGNTAASLLKWDTVECVNDGKMRTIEEISDEIWNLIFE